MKPDAARDSSRIDPYKTLLHTAPGEEPGDRLADRVYGQLLAFIVEQNLDQGDRLPSEHELSRLTAVSRPIVREALTRLQGDGLIESRRGAGSFVRQRPAEHMVQHLLPAQVRARLDTFEIRIAIEPVAARLAAQHRSENELQAIKAATAGLVAALAAGEPAGDQDLEFHRAITAPTSTAGWRSTRPPRTRSSPTATILRTGSTARRSARISAAARAGCSAASLGRPRTSSRPWRSRRTC